MTRTLRRLCTSNIQNVIQAKTLQFKIYRQENYHKEFNIICLLSFKNFLYEKSLISLGMEFEIFPFEYSNGWVVDCLSLLRQNCHLHQLYVE